MQTLQLLCLLWLSLLAITGCALSPQNISLQPRINAVAEPIGQGRALALMVTDQRPQQAFGARGGVYTTALIVPRNDVAQAVQQALAERLIASGFNITQPQSNQGLSMQVMIKRLDYVVDERNALGGPLINEVGVHAVIEAIVNNAGLSRSGQYQANSARRQVGYLSAADNEFILNEVLAQALQQLLQDQDILNLLAQ